MKVTYNYDRMPVCPDCGRGLSPVDAGRRDTETMSGYSVEYFECDNGCGQFELIDDTIGPSFS